MMIQIFHTRKIYALIDVNTRFWIITVIITALLRKMSLGKIVLFMVAVIIQEKGKVAMGYYARIVKVT